MEAKKYTTFKEFYPFYLSEHSNKTNRILHYVGSSIASITFWYLILTGSYFTAPLAFVIGYGFAWIGHFVFEKNTPATFQYPFYSFTADWVMWWQLTTRKIYF